MGIPIAAWADRWNRRNVLALAVAAWRHDGALWSVGEFRDAVLVNVWAAAHYVWDARTLRQDLERTEKLAT